MRTSIVILTIVLLFLVINFYVGIEIEYDIKANLGKVKLRLFNIPIFASKIMIADNFLLFSRKKKNVIKIKLDLNNKQIIFFNHFDKVMKTKIYLRRYEIKGVLCLEDAMVVSMLGSLINACLGVMRQNAKLNNKDATVLMGVDIGYRHTKMEVYYRKELVISLFDVIMAFVSTILWFIRGENEKEQTRKRQTV